MMLVTAQAQRNSIIGQPKDLQLSLDTDDVTHKENRTEGTNKPEETENVAKFNDNTEKLGRDISVLKTAVLRLENENEQLKIQLDQRKTKARQTRRQSLAKMDQVKKEADNEQIRVLNLENQILTLKENNEKLLITNRELSDAVESANAYAEFSKGKCCALESKIEVLEKHLKTTQLNKNVSVLPIKPQKPPRLKTGGKGTKHNLVSDQTSRKSIVSIPERAMANRSNRFSTMSMASDVSTRTALISSFVGEEKTR
mmetsp:Transcript_11999/g.14556  ORF Transcript_11999/g.14556 Transcript_11999/m.14556 type:complete len:256 (+) Transcript_11999:53-820(+)